ncbi:hypothetical protein TNCV_2317021 [Trichonephila clavipes]|nr:hypothetical protein TNCV_2317021 [Trichonephila clavipes]
MMFLVCREMCRTRKVNWPLMKAVSQLYIRFKSCSYQKKLSQLAINKTSQFSYTRAFGDGTRNFEDSKAVTRFPQKRAQWSLLWAELVTKPATRCPLG